MLANDMEFGLTFDALTTPLGDNDLAGKLLKFFHAFQMVHHSTGFFQ